MKLGPRKGQPLSLWMAYACLAGSMALVGSYVGMSKWLLLSFSLPVLALLRFAIAAVFMIPWTPPVDGRPPLSPRLRALLFLESFLGNFLFSVFMLAGVALSSAVTAGIVMAAIPATVAVFSRIFLKESISKPTALGIMLVVMGIAGVTLSSSAEAGSASAHWLGPVLLMAAVACEAAYVVIGKALSAHIHPKNISAWVNLWGLMLIAPWGLIALYQGGGVHVTGLLAWPALLFYALAASVVTVWLWMSGLQTVPANQAGVFTLFLPLASAFVGVVFLDEAFGWPQAMSFALALAGLLLATWPKKLPIDQAR